MLPILPLLFAFAIAWSVRAAIKDKRQAREQWYAVPEPTLRDMVKHSPIPLVQRRAFKELQRRTRQQSPSN